MKNNKGFTLIELLVVIAIIGILSSVVLASLTTARSKGNDAAIKAELSNMRAQAELYYSMNGNYGAPGQVTGACGTGGMFISTATGGLDTILNDLHIKTGEGADGTKVICNASTTAGPAITWAVQASTSVGTWCVDSTGKSTSSSIVTSGLCN